MDGVITDTMPYHFRVWKKIFKDEGIELTPQDIYAREGQKGIESIKEIFAEYHLPFSEAHALELLQRKEHLFRQQFKRRFIPGSRSLIRALARKGFKLALVTGTSRVEAQRILPAGLFAQFSVTVCGDDVQNGKPHPEPYLTALNRLGIFDQEAIVIENAPFGILSALRAGLRCIAIETSLPKPFLKGAMEVFPSFRHLRACLQFEHV